MRLLIDLQGCQNGSRHRGIGRYSLALARGMCRNAGAHEVHFLLNELLPETIEDLHRELAGWVGERGVVRFTAPGPVDELRPENARRKHAAEWLRETMIADIAPDALLISSMVEGSMDDTVSSVGYLDSGAIVGAVLYDLIPLLDPERYIGWEPARRWYHDKLDSLRRCDLLLCISDSAAREATEALPMPVEQVVAISTAADEKFVGAVVSEDELRACRVRFGIRRQYLMHSGNIEARKNFDGLIRAFGALPSAVRSQYQLVLAGKVSAEGQKHLEAEAAKAGLATEDLVLTGHVSDDDLMALYAGCHLFVFPSLHEGFGLPALEAMHFGVATIGSNTTSVPEVIGRADACFDPTSQREMTALMLRCLTDDAFHTELRQHARRQALSFNWDDIAARVWRAFEAALAARQLKSSAHHLQGRATNAALTASQLVAPPHAPPPDDKELAELAHALASNEAQVLRSRAHATPGDTLRWRIEGPFDSSYSLALVNREAARALTALGHHVVLHSTEGPGDFAANPAFLAANPDLQEMHAREPLEPVATADVQARNLYPPRVVDMTGCHSMLHQYAWEESALPPAWVRDFNAHLDGITCTSTHVKKVLQDNGVHVPMTVVGNGVDHWERVVASSGLRFPGKRFRFLHVSSCFPRKGADVMLAAYGDAFTAGDDVSLVIKTFANPHNDIHAQITALRSANPRYPDIHVIEDDLSDSDLKALYQHSHVLVAPSRAEGFGLPLAEAMLSGIPVITTNWSGQLDFCNAENSWLVDFTFAPARTHFDLDGSVWADPDQTSLAGAMTAAHTVSQRQRKSMAEKGRQILLRHFCWQDVAARAVAAVRDRASVVTTPPRIGWVTTWNTRCGIASYSRHIIEAAAEQVTVFAPRQGGLLQADEDWVQRCWLSSKEENAFNDLVLRIDDLGMDVLVVQFNYGFFQLRSFAEFLHGQIDAGRAVIVTMHATGDPPALAEWDDNWRLATAAAALARCDRLLVHSLADMNRLKSAGLVDNVALFPHPLWRLPAAAEPARSDNALPLVATFGYCLPHKGLPETLDAIQALRQRGQPVRLLMLNAEYPDTVSGELVAQLRQQIVRLKLDDLVDFRSEYLPDAEAAALQGEAQLILFPYQGTQESASGAVRHGLASGAPVMVTPIAIFDDLGDAVFRAKGVDAKALADAVTTSLKLLSDGDAKAALIAQNAIQWRAAHDVGQLARRLFDMARALTRQRVDIDYLFEGCSRVLRSEVGLVEGRTLVSSGKDGHLLFGPYLSSPPGRFVAELDWAYVVPADANCRIRVVANAGKNVLFELKVQPGTRKVRGKTELPFQLVSSCGDLEVQLQIASRAEARIHSLHIRADSSKRETTECHALAAAQQERTQLGLA